MAKQFKGEVEITQEQKDQGAIVEASLLKRVVTLALWYFIGRYLGVVFWFLCLLVIGVIVS